MPNNPFHHELIYRGQEVLDSFNKPITICGCGAIGSNLADNLLRQGFNNLYFIDDDRIAVHNLNTQIWNSDEIGALKVDTLINRCYNINEEVLNGSTRRLTDKNIKKLLRGAELVVDAFDNTNSRQLLKDWTGCPVIHAGMFEDYGEVYWNKDYLVPQQSEGLDVCDYPLARNLILLLTSVLTEEIVKFCVDGRASNNYTITLKDFGVRKC
jgi:molybdopterin-synthase adenylyltransferase